MSRHGLLALLLAACGGPSSPAVAPSNVAKPPVESKTCGPGAELAAKGAKQAFAEDEAGALALYEQACAKEAGTGCYSLGTAYNVGLGVEIDRARAEELFTRAAGQVDTGCANGCQDDCATLGWTLYTAQGRAKDGPRSIQVLTKACTAKAPDACFMLATMYSFAYEAPEDQVRALELYREACELGLSIGCNGVAASYQSGDGTSVDMVKAAEVHQRACKLGFAASCRWVAP